MQEASGVHTATVCKSSSQFSGTIKVLRKLEIGPEVSYPLTGCVILPPTLAVHQLVRMTALLSTNHDSQSSSSPVTLYAGVYGSAFDQQ